MGPRTIPFASDNATVGSTTRIHRVDSATDHVVVVSGAVGRTDAAQLEACLMLAASEGEADVLFDARDVTAFDDAASSALTASRSRAGSGATASPSSTAQMRSARACSAANNRSASRCTPT